MVDEGKSHDIVIDLHVAQHMHSESSENVNIFGFQNIT